jgi:hypothetical protein
MGLSISEAVEAMREGEKLRRAVWTGPTQPSYLVFVPGRQVSASFKPMADHIGMGTPFHVFDHVDAIFEYSGTIGSEIGYAFSQADVLLDDWQIVA